MIELPLPSQRTRHQICRERTIALILQGGADVRQRGGEIEPPCIDITERAERCRAGRPDHGWLERTKRIKIGNPLDASNFTGPLIHAQACEKVERYNDLAKKEGALVLLEGGRITQRLELPVKGKLSGGESLLQQVDELATEDATEHFHGSEKRPPAFAAFAIDPA
jgi:hypothetical protein